IEALHQHHARRRAAFGRDRRERDRVRIFRLRGRRPREQLGEFFERLVVRGAHGFPNAYNGLRVKVLFISSEVAPFSKTGGLADVSGALPKALLARGVDVLTVSPLWPQVSRTGLKGGGALT